MAQLSEDKDRNIVPRWRDFATTVSHRELAPLTSSAEAVEIDSQSFEERLSAFRTYRTFSFAADLVSSAIVLGREAEASEAANAMLESDQGFATAKRLAPRVLGIPEPAEAEQSFSDISVNSLRGEVRALKRDVEFDPRNAFRWVDLARAYATLGFPLQSSRAMQIALTLEPNSRFVLRSAARMFLHQGAPDKAFDLLTKHASIRYDPWIMSAEIAFSSIVGRTSDYMRNAQRMLASRRFPPFHLSELGCAIAKQAFIAGDFKRCRQLVRESLVEPSENAVAQASWLGRNLGIEFSAQPLIGVRSSHEASAWGLSFEGKWRLSFDESTRWLADEPFSSGPAILGSFLAAVTLEDYDAAVAIARFGLMSNPNEFLLLNNAACALAQSDRVKEARKFLSRIVSDGLAARERITWMATRGLVEYREGNVEEGRRLYDQATSDALRSGLKELAVKASLFQVLEEVNAHTEGANSLRQEILDLVKDKGIADKTFLPVLHRLRMFVPHSQGASGKQPVWSELQKRRESLGASLKSHVLVARPPLAL